MKNKYSLDDLLYLMGRLRDPKDGCPWDLEQDFDSIIPHTIEESYELAEAINQKDMAQIKEELGDVLFQVIFYSQLAKELEEFQFSDIISSLVTKLVRRHPHVFSQGTLESRVGEQAADIKHVAQTWESIKATERKAKQQQGVLDDVPIALPALTRAEKLQKRAAKVGFDWPDTRGVFDKIQEEIIELQEAQVSGNKHHIADEYGDLLFAVVNLGRHLQVDSESSLRGTNRKFEDRFRYIEQSLSQRKVSINDADLAMMEQLWEQAKTKDL